MLHVRVGGLYPGVEVGGDLAQADSGVTPDWALFISGLKPGKVTHELLVQVGFIQFGSQQQHRLERREKGERWLQQAENIQYTRQIFLLHCGCVIQTTLTVCSLMAGFVSVKP